MRKIIALTALLLLLAASYADAGCAVVRKAIVVQQHAYIAPTYAYVAPVTYGYQGYYNANYDAQQQLIKDQAAFIKLQTEAFQQLRLSPLSNLPGGKGDGAVAGNYENFEAFAKGGGKCIQCHQDGTDKVKENGFVMFEADGKIAPFSIPERRRMAQLIKSGEMPPGNNLPLAERQVAQQLLSKK